MIDNPANKNQMKVPNGQLQQESIYSIDRIDEFIYSLHKVKRNFIKTILSKFDINTNSFF